MARLAKLCKLPGSHNNLLGPGNLVHDELFSVDQNQVHQSQQMDSAARVGRGDGSHMVDGDDAGMFENCCHCQKQE